MLVPGPCSAPLSWLAARQVASGIWFGLHPMRRSPRWYPQVPAEVPAPTVSVPGADTLARPARSGPERGTAPVGPGLPCGVGLGTTAGVPGAPVGPLIGQGGPVAPAQALQWLATHYLPLTTRSQPLGPIFGSGIGLPGMPIGAGSPGIGGETGAGEIGGGLQRPVARR